MKENPTVINKEVKDEFVEHEIKEEQHEVEKLRKILLNVDNLKTLKKLNLNISSMVSKENNL